VEIDGKVLDTSKEITKIDNAIPVLELTTSKTTKSITVVANTTDDSGIAKYEYSIDGGETWIDNEKYNNYTFKKLNHNTDYNIKVRVTDNVGFVNTRQKNETTNLIETPTFSEEGTLNKTVTITYPEGCLSEFTCSYIKNNEKEVIVATSTAQVKYTDEGTLIAKVNDEYNYITSSTYTVTKPDPSEFEGLFIYDVNLVEAVDAETNVNSYANTDLNVGMTLSNANANSSVTYEVVIYNNTDIPYTFSTVELIASSGANNNSNITYSLSGISNGDVILSNKNQNNFKKFRITYYYKNSSLVNNELNSYLQFNFNEKKLWDVGNVFGEMSTSISVSSIPGYSNFTNSNFVLDITSITLPEEAFGTINFTKSYNPSTGVLTINRNSITGTGMISFTSNIYVKEKNVVSLGTNTGGYFIYFDCTGIENYKNKTVDNFVIDLKSVEIPDMAVGTMNFSKSYDSTTGTLSVNRSSIVGDGFIISFTIEAFAI